MHSILEVCEQSEIKLDAKIANQIILIEEGHTLRQLRKIGDMNIIHTSKANMAVATAIAEVVTYEQHLVTSVAVLVGVVHNGIVLIVLNLSDIERCCATNKYRITLEKLAHILVYRAALRLVGVEDELILGLGL